MAGRWRIRHKLMLGLGLVVGVLALLLAGTLKGLAAYRLTTASVDSKIVELREAQKLQLAITTELSSFRNDDQGTSLNDTSALLAKLEIARDKLVSYEAKLQFTLDHRRDSDKGRQERHQVQALWQLFRKLEDELRQMEKTVSVGMGGRTGPEEQTQKKEIRTSIKSLMSTSGDLQDAIYEELEYRIVAAKAAYRSTTWIVLATTAIGVLVMIGLLRFYGWVFYPIRDLEQGVGRVAQGDFEHRIEVHSSDEMEDLAAAFNDMTGRLRDLYGDLTLQVNERSRQLVRSERLASVGFLAAGVAHEINNPLASIAFCAEALEARLFGNEEGRMRNDERKTDASRSDMPHSSFLIPHSDKEVTAKYLRMIQEEAFRCKKITERLLEFSRPGERRREPADLAAIVQAVIDVLQHHQSWKGKQVVLKPSARVVARVNVQEIKSVVLNLVVNALDSMDDGGTLTIRLRQRDGMAELEFADTGCGMTPEVLENIFEPFFTRSRTGKGTGLGLTISHRLVNQHGGEITAASPGPGQGSTFTVRLPLQPAELVAEEEPVGRAA